MTDEQREVILECVVDGELSCAQVFQLSVELDLTLRQLGEFCNREKIKVRNCQLGMFK